MGSEQFGPWLMGDGLLLRASTPRMSLATASVACALADIYNVAAKAQVGAPSAREVVRVENGYGVVVDYLPGRNLGMHIVARSWAPRRAGREMGGLLRNIHEVSARVGRDWKAQFCSWTQCLCPLIPKALGERLVGLVENIPEQTTLLHGDLHVHNIIVGNGRLAVIDWEEAGFGDPVFDLAIARSRLLFAMPRGFAHAGLPAQLGERMYRVVWDALLASYFADATPAELEACDRQIAALAEVESCCFAYGIARLNDAEPSELQRRRVDEAAARMINLLP